MNELACCSRLPSADRYRSDWLTQVIEESPGLAELLQDAAVDTTTLSTGLLGNQQQQEQ